MFERSRLCWASHNNRFQATRKSGADFLGCFGETGECQVLFSRRGGGLKATA